MELSSPSVGEDNSMPFICEVGRELSSPGVGEDTSVTFESRRLRSYPPLV